MGLQHTIQNKTQKCSGNDTTSRIFGLSLLAFNHLAKTYIHLE